MFWNTYQIQILSVGAYAVFPFHKETQKYEVYDNSIKVQVVVTHDTSQHVLVQTTSSQTGKFHFTAIEHGLHLICLYVFLLTSSEII